MESLTVSTLCTIIVTIGSVCGALAVLYKHFKNFITSIVKEVGKEDIEKTIKEVLKSSKEEDYNEIKTLFENGLKELDKKVEQISSQQEKEMKVMKKAIQDSLKERLMSIYEERMGDGYINEYDMYAANQLFTDYINLGGDYFIQDRMEELRRLRDQSYKIDEARKNKKNQ